MKISTAIPFFVGQTSYVGQMIFDMSFYIFDVFYASWNIFWDADVIYAKKKKIKLISRRPNLGVC